MTNSKQDQLEQLKQHFGRRVHEQARSIVNGWSTLQDVHWNEVWFDEFSQSAAKLHKLADRYKFTTLAAASQQLSELLVQEDGHKAPKSDVLEKLNRCISDIADACSRVNDDLPVKQMSAGRKPVYLCFKDPSMASSLAEQMSHFGIPTQCYDDSGEFEKSILYRLPSAIIVDKDFADDGIALVTKLQGELRAPIPAVFYSANPPTIEERLAVVRANGIAFFDGQLDFGMLIEQLMSIYSLRNEPPYRVLVVDDSRSQSTYAEKTLNFAGIFTRAVNQPLDVIDVMDSFHPDAILMDMYMPGCMGPELAQVIRQQAKYDAIPILYLSAESDIEKQLDAVSRGGDDFLTKPVPKDVLIATVINRCRRHRGLREQMIRDSLTGLVDHNNTLEALKNDLKRMASENKPVSFAMIDIDRFKLVNDTYGHGMGDRVIHALALYLRQRFRMTDTIGRYGGEEFAVILPDTDEATAYNLLNEVRDSFAKLVHRHKDTDITVTFSCGVASSQPDEEFSELAQRADSALYAAKRNGRNQVCMASDAE
ncbi:diguanylate cyclase [Reinekea sp. G2M2-21]|uniref:GGDEF domain-containing response regulator n=1 Tax=Reinekea sp. G2M2-21 TaxID=2788942 RepID=UPI0018AAD694